MWTQYMTHPRAKPASLRLFVSVAHRVRRARLVPGLLVLLLCSVVAGAVWQYRVQMRFMRREQAARAADLRQQEASSWLPWPVDPEPEPATLGEHFSRWRYGFTSESRIGIAKGSNGSLVLVGPGDRFPREAASGLWLDVDAAAYIEVHTPRSWWRVVVHTVGVRLQCQGAPEVPQGVVCRAIRSDMHKFADLETDAAMAEEAFVTGTTVTTTEILPMVPWPLVIAGGLTMSAAAALWPLAVLVARRPLAPRIWRAGWCPNCAYECDPVSQACCPECGYKP